MANENIVGEVEDLLNRYQAALGKATDLIELKDQYIDILESEIVLRKRQNLILSSILIACLIAFAFIISLYCIL